MKKNNVFVCQRTGRGKSLCYQGFTTALGNENCIVIVVSPLVSIMEEQVSHLNNLGIPAVMLGKCHVDDKKAKEGAFRYVYASPELLLANTEWRSVLKSLKEKIKMIVVDEAHLVIQWGMSSEQSDAFRVWFSRIGELRNLIPSANIIALTATASKTLRTQIERKLHMSGCVEVVDSLDRSNLKLFRKKVSASQELSITFDWLMQRLRNSTLPRMLIFSKSIADCSRIYNMCRTFRDIDMKQVNMFHSQTPKEAKEHIMKDMANVDGTIKLLSCTNAAGMGINFKGVDMVVSYGPPQDMDTFVQHLGRAGRDGAQSSHLLVYHGRQVRNLNSDMRMYLKTEGCLRTAMFSYNVKSDVSVGHLCCDACTETCECGEDTCQTISSHPALQDDDSDEEEDEQNGVSSISEDEKRTTSALLEQYFDNCSTTESYFSSLDSRNLERDIISSVLSQLQTLHSATDVLEQTIITDYNVAKAVFSVIADVLNLDHLVVSEEDDESDFDDYS